MSKNLCFELNTELEIIRYALFTNFSLTYYQLFFNLPLGNVCLFVCLSVCRQIFETLFLRMCKSYEAEIWTGDSHLGTLTSIKI
jgi:hypothetical protein